jgi:hypothetical protein
MAERFYREKPQLRKAPLGLPQCEWFGNCHERPTCHVLDGYNKNCGTFCDAQAEQYIFKFGAGK